MQVFVLMLETETGRMLVEVCATMERAKERANALCPTTFDGGFEWMTCEGIEISKEDFAYWLGSTLVYAAFHIHPMTVTE